MPKYYVVFKYVDKIEYYQDPEKSSQKPFDSELNGFKMSLEDAEKVKQEYLSNPYGKYEDIILEKV